MTRNFKVLAMAFAAACTFAALSASAASAAETDAGTGPIAHFTCSSYPCSVKGNQIGKHTYAVAGGEMTCNTATFEGTPIEKASTSLTVHPKYEGCTLHNELIGQTTSATVFMNECYYTFTVHSKGTAGETPTVTESVNDGAGKVTDYWHGDVHIKCPAGKSIIIRTYKDAEHKEVHCEFQVTSTTVEKIDYRVETINGVAKHTDVTATNSPTTLKRLKGGLFACGTENQEAKYNGATTVESLKGGAEVPGDIGFVTTDPVTIPIAHFTCSSYPCSVKGNQIGKHTYAVAGGEMTCNTATFEGTPIEKASTSLTVHPKYEGCTLHNELIGQTTSATVFMNECYYTFTVHSKGTAGETPTETASVDDGAGKVTDYWHGDVHIKCPAGKSIIIRTYKDAGHTEVHCEFQVTSTTVEKIDYRIETINSVAKHTDVTATNSSTTLKKLKGSLFACGTESQEAKYNGETTVESLDEAGAEVPGDIGLVTT